MNVSIHVRWALIVLAVMIVVMLMSKWTGRPSHSDVTLLVQKAASNNKVAHADPCVANARIHLNNARTQLQAAVAASSTAIVSRIAGEDVNTLLHEMDIFEVQLNTQPL